MRPSGVYRTNGGRVFRITETVEGGLKVEVLEDDTWVAGRISMVGLRLARSTKKLSSDAILELPA